MWLETLIKSLTPSLLKAMLKAMDDKACLQLFKDLFAIAGKSQPSLSKAARERLRRLPLSLEHLEALFASLCHHLEEASGVEQKAGKRSKTKGGGGGGVGDEGSSVVLARAVSEALVVLDVLQAHEDPAHAMALMPDLFKLLAAINVSRAAISDDGDESLVQVCTRVKRALLCKLKSPILQAEEPYYDVDDGDECLLQSLLAAILALLQAEAAVRDKAATGGNVKGSKKDAKEKEGGVDMQALVSCIRSAVSPQTRHEALNCLVELARSKPKTVLKHVMAVFAFLGESAWSHDDQYSFHVIEHTIKSVIPPLLENGMEPKVYIFSPLKCTLYGGFISNILGH